MRRLFLLTALTIISFVSVCQNLIENQEKYWSFRERFLEEFILVGEGQGKSLPAVSRHENFERMGWGDATLHLGWYLAMLSTEYHLSLKNSFVRTEDAETIDKERTLLELYYALKTVERLDLSAEPFFVQGADPLLNGFFIRDDVPAEMYSKFAKMKSLESDYTKPDKRANEESHDQVHHLMLGLMAVHKLIPEAVKVKGESLNEMAVQNGTRILQFLIDYRWHVKNPVLTKSNGKAQKVMRGGEGYIYSAGAKHTLKEFDSESHHFRINPLNKIFWSSLRMGINPTYIKDDNAHMAMTVATAGNGFRRTTFRKMVKRAKKDEWYVYPLMNLALYPENKRFKKDKDYLVKSRALLDIAPPEGPHSTYPETNTHGWTVNNRFMRQESELYMNKPHTIGADYHALDYMLLHNLYLIHLKGLIPEAEKRKK